VSAYAPTLRDRVGVRIVNALCRVLLTREYRARLTVFVRAGMTSTYQQSMSAIDGEAS